MPLRLIQESATRRPAKCSQYFAAAYASGGQAPHMRDQCRTRKDLRMPICRNDRATGIDPTRDRTSAVRVN
eukprot:scaffold134904_cov29-Prasinocladus_malaysianus.AAC.1